jgi:hypothetical protein
MFNQGIQVEARNLLLENFAWFTHTTPAANLSSIRSHGLEPREPGSVYFPNALVNSRYARAIVCLAPHPIARPWNALRHDPPYTRLALASSDLPTDIGLDWSYQAPWNRAGDLADERPGDADASILVRASIEYGVFVSYRKLEASCLRVFAVGTDINAPGTWPRLADTANCDAALIGPDTTPLGVVD